MGIAKHMQYPKYTCFANLCPYIIYIQGATYNQTGPLIPMFDLSKQIMEFTYTLNININQAVQTEKRQIHPLTRAKSRDHEIVRAQKNVSECRPVTPPKSCSVVMDP